MIRVLVSSTEISVNKIGSWTQRITAFTSKYPGFFDFYLGPMKKADSKYIFCKKRSINRFSKVVRFFANPLHRTSSYLTAFKRIYDPSKTIQVLVMDDIMLLAGFALLKDKGFQFQLIYSFHGHAFRTTGTWMNQVDKVLFLTELGYLQTKNLHQEFTPEVFILGNGVDSQRYFPLSQDEKRKTKISRGYIGGETILTWLSNDRPKKGLKLFFKLLPRLLHKYPNLRIQIIGNEVRIPTEDSRVISVGRIPNSELPSYLQISDLYCFTSLWEEGFGLTLVEAAKCGNLVVASRNGGIPEVVKDTVFSFLVDSPNILRSWENQIESAMKFLDIYNPDVQALAEYHCLSNWEQKFLQVLDT